MCVCVCVCWFVCVHGYVHSCVRARVHARVQLIQGARLLDLFAFALKYILVKSTPKKPTFQKRVILWNDFKRTTKASENIMNNFFFKAGLLN